MINAFNKIILYNRNRNKLDLLFLYDSGFNWCGFSKVVGQEFGHEI